MPEEEKDYSELDALIDEAKKAGVDPDVAAEWVDGLVDFNDVLPQPLGAIAEALDGPAVKAVGRAVKKLGKKAVAILTDPEARAKHKAKRKAKKAKRKAKKAAREAE